MPKVRMKVEGSGSLAKLSKDQSDVTFRILTSLSTDTGHVTLVESENLNPDVLSEFLEHDSEVLSYEVLHTDKRTTVVQVLQDFEPAAGRAGRESGNPPPYPLVLRDGWVYSESTATHDLLSQFKAQLDAVGVRYELLSVVQSHDPTELLTDRQREFVREALDRGYYDNPRQCTLTDIAKVVGVNKATASGILHRAEGAIIKEFMSKPGLSEETE